MSGDTAPAPDRSDGLLAAHYLPVMRLCLSRLRDQADAEDATQEVFRRAVQHAARLQGDPLPWLLTVARNVCTDELRRRRRLAAQVTPEETLPAPEQALPERVVVGRLSAVELLGRLTPGERRAVAQRLAAAETPATSTTRVLLARARDKVRRYLEDTQAAVGTATVYGTEALHQLRARLLGRTLLGSGRAAVVIPALLIIGVVGGPASPGGTPRLVPHSAPSALGPGDGDSAQARRLRDETEPSRGATLDDITRTALGAADAATGGGTLQLPPRSVWYPALPSDDYQQVNTYDIEPSPYYSTDHTVFMTGAAHNCYVQVCGQTYRSSDGGATWHLLGSQPVAGLRLALPPSRFGSGKFYAGSEAGAMRTEDGGANFVTILPGNAGYPLVPHHSGEFDLYFTTVSAIWGIRPDGSSQMLSIFDGGDEVDGNPLLLDAPGGDLILQPVMPPGDEATLLLERCTPACGPAEPLPLAQTVRLVASSDVASDHTIYATDGATLAVSHDDGVTFSAVKAPEINDLIAIEGPHGRRLVAAVGQMNVLEYSDDEGNTWQPALLPAAPLNQAHTIVQLRPGRLIASMARTDDYGWYFFVCSSDGSSWTSCSPDAS